jgi:motility quorum-sensing regulator / GCU-specific mRNA interferase toxin
MVYLISMAEKRKPTYDLDAFKATFSTVEKLAVTGTALRGAASLGFGRAEIVSTIQTMQRGHFFKSMTAYADSRLWQDVYHVPSTAGMLYVKFTADAITEFLLLSFKEKDHE